MPTYIYKACDLQGKLVKGREEFATRSELADALKKDGLLLIDVKEGIPRFKLFESLKKIKLFKSSNVKKKRDVDVFEVFRKVKPRDIMAFSLQLSNMLGVGIPLLDSLGILTQQASNKKIGKIIENIHRDVEAGGSFSLALGVYPRSFSPLFVSMVKLGEAIGHLDSTLSKLTEFIQHDMDLRQKFKSALTYPAILCVLGFVVVMFITIFVMPQFVQMFKEAGVRLSLPTLIVYGFGQAVKRFWYLILPGSILLITGIRFYLRTKSAKLIFDRLILEIPVIGPLSHKVILSRFAMTLSVLVAAGVPLLESLKMVENAVGNVVIAKVVKDACGRIGRGAKIADAFKVSDKIPVDMVQMIAVGEEAGRLDTMLAKISTFYDVDVDNAIKGLTALIEPLFVVIMGLVVGFIMFSLFIPLFKMVNIIGV